MVTLRVTVGECYAGEFKIELRERISLDRLSDDNRTRDGRHYFMGLIGLYNSDRGGIEEPTLTKLECYPCLGGQYGKTLKFLLGADFLKLLGIFAKTGMLGDPPEVNELHMDDDAYHRMMRLIKDDIRLNGGMQ